MQPKLTVNDPDDKYEREAERVADAVMRMSDPTMAAEARERLPTDRIQRMCPRCQRRHRQGKPLNCEECETLLHRHTDDRDGTDGDAKISGGVEQAVAVTDRPGRPLSDDVRSFFETRFGRDFGSVRVHQGPKANAAARSINANAFTIGTDIVFARGKENQQTDAGRRLLAHELAHVVQQTNGESATQGTIASTLVQRESPHVRGYGPGDPEMGRTTAYMVRNKHTGETYKVRRIFQGVMVSLLDNVVQAQSVVSLERQLPPGYVLRRRSGAESAETKKESEETGARRASEDSESGVITLPETVIKVPTPVLPGPTCGRPREAVPIIEYIRGEMSANVKSSGVKKMRELNEFTAEECIRKAQNRGVVAQMLGPSAEDCAQRELSSRLSAITLWTQQVRTDGPWDHKPYIHKNFARQGLSKQAYHQLYKWAYFYDIWSNIHYGFVGAAAGFSKDALLDGAGLEQIGSTILSGSMPQRSEGVSGMRAFDDPSDRMAVAMGYDFYSTVPSTQGIVDQVLKTSGLTRKLASCCQANPSQC